MTDCMIIFYSHSVATKKLRADNDNEESRVVIITIIIHIIYIASFSNPEILCRGSKAYK